MSVREAWENAWSMESCPDPTNIEEVGRFRRGKDSTRGYIIYKDNAGNYWYKTVFQGEKGLISEEEHIFGKRLLRGGTCHRVPR